MKTFKIKEIKNFKIFIGSINLSKGLVEFMKIKNHPYHIIFLEKSYFKYLTPCFS
jgi:hypothetical protein